MINLFGAELELGYLISQVLTAIEYGLLGISYLVKNRRAIVVLDIFSMACGIAAYILLGADLGVGMSIVILVANFYYLYQERHPKLLERRHWWDYAMLAAVLGAIGIIAACSYNGAPSLLSVVATVLYEISLWQRSPRVYKILGIPVAVGWMAYNGFILSPVGVICEAAMLVAAVIGTARAELLRRRELAQQQPNKRAKKATARKAQRQPNRNSGNTQQYPAGNSQKAQRQPHGNSDKARQ